MLSLDYIDPNEGFCFCVNEPVTKEQDAELNDLIRSRIRRHIEFDIDGLHIEMDGLRYGFPDRGLIWVKISEPNKWPQTKVGVYAKNGDSFELIAKKAAKIYKEHTGAKI